MLKLDRPDWNGLSAFEATVLARLADAGLPVARAHGTVTVDGRGGVVLGRVEGPSLLRVVEAAGPGQIDSLAADFVALQLRCNATVGRRSARAAAAPRRRDRGQRPRRRTAGGAAGAARRAGRSGAAASATSTSTRPTCWSDRTAGSSSTGSPWRPARRRRTWPAPSSCGGSGRRGRPGASCAPSAGRANAGAACRRSPRRLGTRGGGGPGGRGLRGRGAGVAPPGGERLRAVVRLTRRRSG